MTKLSGQRWRSPTLQKWIVVGARRNATNPRSARRSPRPSASFPPDAQTAAFDALLKRADWTGCVPRRRRSKAAWIPATLGPANACRLRTHPDKDVAQRAPAMLEELEPDGEGEERSDREARADRRAEGQRRRMARRSSPRRAPSATSSATSARTSGPASPAWARTGRRTCSPRSSIRTPRSIRASSRGTSRRRTARLSPASSPRRTRRASR